MNIGEFYACMEKALPQKLCAEWDNDGIAVCPDVTHDVSRVLICLDVTMETVAYALAGHFDVIVSHHPLLFHPIRSLCDGDGMVSRKLLRLARAGVSAISFHTRLDAVEGGVNDVLAKLLGLQEVTPFGPDGEIPCGRIGTLAEPMSAVAFAKLCGEVLHATPCLTGEGMVRRVALLGGSGGDYIDAARLAGADIFLTGEVSYHRALDSAERGLPIVAVGHYHSEFPVTKRLCELVSLVDADIVTEIFPTQNIIAI